MIGPIKLLLAQMVSRTINISLGVIFEMGLMFKPVQLSLTHYEFNTKLLSLVRFWSNKKAIKISSEIINGEMIE